MYHIGIQFATLERNVIIIITLLFVVLSSNCNEETDLGQKVTKDMMKI